MKLELKDKKGIKLIELDPKKKYFMVISRENAGVLPQCKFEPAFRKLMASKYIFIVDDINAITFEEKKEFAKQLLNE